MVNFLLKLNKPKRIILYSSIGIIFIIFLFMLLIYPKIRILRVKDIELKDKERIYQEQYEIVTQNKKELAIAKERLEKLKQENKKLLQEIKLSMRKEEVIAQDLITFFNDFAQTAEENDARLIYIKPVEEASSEQLVSASTYEIKLIGKYSAIVNIFTNLDYQGLLNNLENFSIKIEDGYPNLQLLMRIKLLKI